MIDYQALYGISYGLYIVSSGNQNRGNGFISNTVFQATAEPPRFVICSNKDNYTSEFIRSTGLFAVSILEINTPIEIFSRFGYKTGRELDKFNGMNLRYTENGVPVVLDHALSFLECRVETTIDMHTHWMFTALLLHSEIIDNRLDPITYQYYREVKKGLSPKNAPTYIDLSKFDKKTAEEKIDQYKCSVCGYIYDESDHNMKFADLPDDYACPLCGAAKEDFIKL